MLILGHSGFHFGGQNGAKINIKVSKNVFENRCPKMSTKSCVLERKSGPRALKINGFTYTKQQFLENRVCASRVDFGMEKVSKMSSKMRPKST